MTAKAPSGAVLLKPEALPTHERGGGARTTPLVSRELGTTSFITGYTSFDAGVEIPFHSHNCQESVVLMEGEAILDIDGLEYELKPHDVTFIPPNVNHRFRNLSKTKPIIRSLAGFITTLYPLLDENVAKSKITKEIFGANSFFRKIVDFCIRVITGIFKFAGSCFGIFCILFGGILLLLIFSFAFSGAEILFQNHPMVEHVYSNFFNNKSATWFSLFIGIPMVAIILFGLRLVNNTKIHMNYKIGIFVLWIISLFFLLNSAEDISIEFQEEAKNTIIENIITESDTLYLSMNDVNRELVKTIPGLIPQFKVTPFEDNLIGIGMQLDVVKSKNDNFNLIKEATARGKNKYLAKEMTEGVGFEFLLEDDNLIFDDFFTISTQKWRMQELYLTLEIPVGMVVFLDHSLEDLIYDIKNVNNMWDYDMLGHYWKMEEEGLSCISCED